MIITTRETLKLVGYSTCEIIVQIVGVLVFTILLCLKVSCVMKGTNACHSVCLDIAI